MAQWLVDKPCDTNFESEVQWKGMDIFVTILSHTPPPPLDDTIHHLPLIIEEGVISLVKSNLQKCVRRKLTEKAMRTARLFMNMDISLFLRRLSIIMMEDVILHQSFPTLMWLIAAVSKGFYVTSPMREWLMGIVEKMCQEDREDYWTHKIDNTTTLLTPDTLRRMYKRVENHGECNMIYSLLFRMAYGGLPGDLAMITHFASLVEGGTIIPSISMVRSIPINNITPLSLAQIEPCSVDFHCYPQIVSILVREKKQQYTHLQIKNAIWHHNSRFNKRVILPETEKRKLESLQQIWQSIKGRLWYLQKEYIVKCENNHAYANRVR
jgi:hypothetical protein